MVCRVTALNSTPVIFYPTDFVNPHSCDLDAQRPPRRLASTAVRALSCLNSRRHTDQLSYFEFT